jgi:imidazole glycerol phosphate synthase subunit HisF
MDAKRIIPVLQVRDGLVPVPGSGPGHPAEWACRLALEGADGIIFREAAGEGRPGRELRAAWLREVAGSLFIPIALEAPFTSLAELEEALEAGADKVVLDAATAATPILAAAAQRFGRSHVSVAVDAVPEAAADALARMAELEQLGAGEILLQVTPEAAAGALIQKAARLAISVLFRSAGDPALAAEALLHGAEGLAFPAMLRTSADQKSLLTLRGLTLRQ